MTYPYAQMFQCESKHWWHRSLRAALHLERLSGRHLDVGCGTGGNLLEHGGIGLDFGLEALQLCVQRGATRLVCGDANALPFAAGSFDSILAADLFESMEVDAPGAVKELARVAKPGARLVISVPAHQWLLSRHDATFHTVRRFSVGLCYRLFGASGWYVTGLRWVFGALLPAFVVWRLLRLPATLAIPPRWLNALLYALARVPLPWGSTLIVEAVRT